MSTLSPSLELEPDESVIWTGQPLPDRVMRQSVPIGLYGLCFVSFTLLWMGFCVSGRNNNWDRNWNPGKAVPPFAMHNVLIAAGAGLWFLPPGIYMCLWPLLALRQAKETEYVITGQRALIFKPGLFGGRRVLSFPPKALALIQCEECEGGTGDIVFENRKGWYGMHERVGFIAVERVREVETVLRKLLAGGKILERPASGCSSDRASENPASLSTLQVSPKTYTLPMSLQLAIGLFAIVFSLVTLLVAFSVIAVPLGILLGLLPAAAAATVLVSLVCLVPCAIMTHRVLTMPIEIAIDDDRSISLKSSFGIRSISAADIISIRTGGWIDPNSFYAQIHHNQGKIYLVNCFAEFREFLIAVKSMNPAVEVSGF